MSPHVFACMTVCTFLSRLSCMSFNNPPLDLYLSFFFIFFSFCFTTFCSFFFGIDFHSEFLLFFFLFEISFYSLLCHFERRHLDKGIFAVDPSQDGVSKLFFRFHKKMASKVFCSLWLWKKRLFLIAIAKCFYKIFCYLPSVYKSGNHTYS
jgi:hypothetical protein